MVSKKKPLPDDISSPPSAPLEDPPSWVPDKEAQSCHNYLKCGRSFGYVPFYLFCADCNVLCLCLFKDLFALCQQDNGSPSPLPCMWQCILQRMFFKEDGAE